MVEVQTGNDGNNQVLAEMVQLLEEGYFKDNPHALQRPIITAYGELARAASR